MVSGEQNQLRAAQRTFNEIARVNLNTLISNVWTVVKRLEQEKREESQRRDNKVEENGEKEKDEEK